MKQFRYRYAPIILIICNLVLVGAILTIRKLTNYSELVIWLPFVLIQLFVNYYCGTLIKILYSGAYKDILTGLPNRRYFYERLTSEIEGVKRSNSKMCLALIDVDNFKIINDKHGHLEGDKALQRLASVLRGNVRTIDFLARWGGDEFVIILPQTNLDGAFILAERLRKGVESYPFPSELTLSIGIVSADESIDLDRLLVMVDDALYKAKKDKNNIFIYS
ncbi:MAG: GGDEF domain-containing protein [Bacillota bacterium]